MNSDPNAHAILELCENGQIYGALEEYLLACACSDDTHSDDTAISDRNSKKSKKQETKNLFPNLAGFCRHLQISTLEFDEVREKYPSQCARILTVLEDEALNSGVSSNVISAYLKKRLGYESPQKVTQGDTQLHIQFEHDIFEDGQ